MGTRRLEGAPASAGQPPLGRAEAPRPRGLPLPRVRRQRRGEGSAQRGLGEIQDSSVRFATPFSEAPLRACATTSQPDLVPFQTAPDRNPENIRIEGHVPHEMDINWEVGAVFERQHLLSFCICRSLYSLDCRRPART